MILAQLDAVGLLLTQAFFIQLDSLIDASKQTVTILDVEPNRSIAVEDRISLQDIRNANNYYPGFFLRVAIRDYSEAMRSPRSAAFYCYRAIESLRQFFEQMLLIDDRNFAWKIFREHIPINEEDTRKVGELAKADRHGEPFAITGDARFFCIRIACAAIVYFVEIISASLADGIKVNKPI